MVLRTLTLIVVASTVPESSGFAKSARKTVVVQPVLWQSPGNVAAKNLFYGSGSRAGAPVGPFRFVKEDSSGTNPKFEVRDARGLRWKVKLGEEVRPETAATRLVWAAGYFVDETYYLPRIRIAGLPELKRGKEFITGPNTVSEARLERLMDVPKIDGWSWFKNPFIGTKEFDGLRVLLTLMNAWDLKESNNRIEMRGRQARYMVSDLGATFGKSGNNWSRTKGDVEDYLNSRFIDDVEKKQVDFELKTRPPILYAIAVPYYLNRAKMEKVGEDIPVAHARWIGRLLAGLSDAQLRDAFRAAGYPPAEVATYSRKVRARIRVLNRL
jgi:hypothetical protein